MSSKGHFADVGMSTNKSLNYLDNQNTQPTIAHEALDEGNFFVGTIFDILRGQKQQQINQHNHWGEKHRVVSHTQYQQDQQFIQNWLWCSSQ